MGGKRVTWAGVPADRGAVGYAPARYRHRGGDGGGGGVVGAELNVLQGLLGGVDAKVAAAGARARDGGAE